MRDSSLSSLQRVRQPRNLISGLKTKKASTMAGLNLFPDKMSA